MDPAPVSPVDLGPYYSPAAARVHRDQFNNDRSRRAVAAMRPAASVGPVPHPSLRTSPYEDEESRFLRAMSDYQSRTGTRYPSYSEILRVLRDLGYRPAAPG